MSGFGVNLGVRFAPHVGRDRCIRATAVRTSNTNGRKPTNFVPAYLRALHKQVQPLKRQAQLPAMATPSLGKLSRRGLNPADLPTNWLDLPDDTWASILGVSEKGTVCKSVKSFCAVNKKQFEQTCSDDFLMV